MAEKHTLFFQIAAGLIPALLFGGVVSNHLSAPENIPAGRRGQVVAGAVGLGVLSALLAEWFAIELAFAEAPAPWKAPVVVFAVVAGTAVLAGVLLQPWVRLMRPQRYEHALFSLVAVLSLWISLGTVFLGRAVYEAMLITEVQKNELADARESGPQNR